MSPSTSSTRDRGTARTGPLAGHVDLEHVPALDVDALLDDPDTHIVVCTGSGGVG
jgi:hypothetical protein